MKIGIFGCTADPFTPAHYEIVKTCLENNAVDKVIILPTIVDYYRQDKHTLFSVNDRRAIIEHWILHGFMQASHEEDVILDCYEYDVVLKHDEQTVKSRRYLHMLEDVISRYGKSNEYFTIVGGDSLEKFQTWYKWEDVLKLSRIIAFPRRSSAIDDIDKSISSKIQILTIDNRFNAISASDVRERLLNDIDGMSLGPNGTAFELYLSDVDDYLKTGKTYLDHDIEHANVENALKNVRMHMHEKTLNMKEQKLMKIMDVLKDACKDVECKYSIIQEIMNGRHEEW